MVPINMYKQCLFQIRVLIIQHGSNFIIGLVIKEIRSNIHRQKHKGLRGQQAKINKPPEGMKVEHQCVASRDSFIVIQDLTNMLK